MKVEQLLFNHEHTEQDAAFVGKFKPNKPTDECYTPEPVYQAVLDWVAARVDLIGKNIRRPFVPNGNYETEVYGENDVVIDNPPFSILAKIVQFYTKKGIAFFLFAPHLTVVSSVKDMATLVITNTHITYANGAVVNTDFVSNMFGNIAFMTAPELSKSLEMIFRNPTPLPKYQYPANVLTTRTVETLIRAGIEFVAYRDQCRFIPKLRSQIPSKKAIFGGGYLVSDTVAADLAAKQEAAKQEAAKQEAAKQEVVVWPLSEQERLVIEQLR